MSSISLKSVEDIVSFAREDYCHVVYVRTRSKKESDFIQKEFQRFGVRAGACGDYGYPKYIGIFTDNGDLYSSGHGGVEGEADKTISFEDFKKLVSGGSDSESLEVLDIQSKLKVIEHYLNGGDIQFFSDSGHWVDFTSNYILNVIRINEIRIKPKIYVLDGVSLTRDQLIKVVNGLN